MAYRTTVKDLRNMVRILNGLTGNPTSAWQTGPDGRLAAIPGVYILDCAYGGYRLCQMVSETGGERDITPRYSAVVAASLIRAYTDGFMAGRQNTALPGEP